MNEPDVVTTTTITCPSCGHSQQEEMPTDACRVVWQCPECGAMARPLPGDCCVFCSYAEHRCPPEQIEARAQAPSNDGHDALPRPGLVGIGIRLALGVAVTAMAIQTVRDTPSFWDGYTDPWGSVPLALILLFVGPVVVQELLQRDLGLWPAGLLLGGGLLSTALGAASGYAFGPAYGIYLWTVSLAVLGLLGPAFLLGALLRTPGCEMRSYAHLWTLVRGGDPNTVACPGWIDRFDHVRIMGRW